MNKELIYSKLPILLQNLACSTEGYRLQRRRYNQAYKLTYQSLEKNPILSIDELSNLQEHRLSAFLLKAKQTTYWKNKLPTDELIISDPRTILNGLPILSKFEVKSAVSDITNHSITEIISAHTSGTTGSGLIFPVTNNAEQEQFGVWWRYRNWHGVDQNSWCGYFAGRSIVPINQNKPPYWRHNIPGKQLMFSGYHLSEDTVAHYIDALNHYQPSWLHGYPSILSVISQLIIDKKLILQYRPNVITVGAESLLNYQRELIKKAFDCPVRQHYGMAEGVANISECTQGNFHVDEDFSLVEFIQTDFDSKTYKIIGTNWSNPAFPLIRYDTGDLAVIESGECKCSLNGRIVSSIEGRVEDFVTLPNGVKLGRLDHIFKDVVDIKEAQIYQKSIDKITIRLVKGNNFSASTESRILHEARQRIGNQVDITIEFLPEIEKTPRGKLKFVVSDI